jgi:hypothetical protein
MGQFPEAFIEAKPNDLGQSKRSKLQKVMTTGNQTSHHVLDPDKINYAHDAKPMASYMASEKPETHRISLVQI